MLEGSATGGGAGSYLNDGKGVSKNGDYFSSGGAMSPLTVMIKFSLSRMKF